MHMLKPDTGYGYYPLTIGELLDDGKYEIVRKLGWAKSSSVWLALVHDEDDGECAGDEDRESDEGVEEPHKVANDSGSPKSDEYVAIKVLTVNATAGIMKGHPGYKHCLKLHDWFMAYSKHGPHISLVTEVLGMDILLLKVSQPNCVLSLPVTKRIVKQTLLSLDYLHRECSLVHGDLKAENTLVSLDKAGGPLPNFNVDPTSSNFSIQVIDYGHSTPVGQVPDYDVQPVLLRAPEVILGHPWSTPIDIWSLGVTIFEYLIVGALFELHESSSVSFTDVHLQRITEYIGPFPESFLAACSHRAEYFDEQGLLLRVEDFLPRSVEESLRSHGFLEEKDIAPTAAFILRCLVIDPTIRPSALQLLDDKWLNDA